MADTKLEIIETEEPWGRCKLSDGTVVKFRKTLTHATRLEGQYEADGSPIYAFVFIEAVSVLPNPDLVQKLPTKGFTPRVV